MPAEVTDYEGWSLVVLAAAVARALIDGGEGL
jgi:hypothetical protein